MSTDVLHHQPTNTIIQIQQFFSFSTLKSEKRGCFLTFLFFFLPKCQVVVSSLYTRWGIVTYSAVHESRLRGFNFWIAEYSEAYVYTYTRAGKRFSPRVCVSHKCVTVSGEIAHIYMLRTESYLQCLPVTSRERESHYCKWHMCRALYCTLLMTPSPCLSK